jgi:hypothetical protein
VLFMSILLSEIKVFLKVIFEKRIKIIIIYIYIVINSGDSVHISHTIVPIL